MCSDHIAAAENAFTPIAAEARRKLVTGGLGHMLVAARDACSSRCLM